MRRAASTVIIGMLLVSATLAADQLVYREVHQINPGSKDLKMTFREVRRDERTSLAKVKYESGASVPSSMFVIRGFYDIASARGAKYFINLKEWDAPDGDRMYLVGVSNDNTVSIPEYFKFAEAASVPDRHEFLSVERFGRLFEGRK